MSKEFTEYQQMVMMEIRVLEAAVERFKQENDKINEINKDLLTRLKIPRLHYKYLEENGTLEEFVKAKIDNKDGSEILEKTLENKMRKEKRKINMSSLRTALNSDYMAKTNHTFSKFSSTTREHDVDNTNTSM